MSVRLLFCSTLILAATFAAAETRAGSRADAEIRLRRDTNFLASDECDGRGGTTKGINRAADYLAVEFKKAGLKPAGADGSYFQPFTMTGSAKLGSPNSVVLHAPNGEELA